MLSYLVSIWTIVHLNILLKIYTITFVLTCFYDKQCTTNHDYQLLRLPLVFHILDNFYTHELCKNGKTRHDSWSAQVRIDNVHMSEMDLGRLLAILDSTLLLQILRDTDVASGDDEIVADYCCAMQYNTDVYD